jgi:ribonuclease R
MATSFTERLLREIGKSRDGLAFNAIQKRLQSGEADRDTLKSLVDSLVTTGRLVRMPGGKLVDPDAMGWTVGRLAVTRKGMGFIIPDRREGTEQDLMIPRRGLGDAVDGDRVAARFTGKQRGRASGWIEMVLHRAHARLVGQYFHGRRVAQVVPRAKRLSRQVEVPAVKRPDLRDGMWVVVEITEWTRGDDPLFGKVVDVIGEAGTPDADLPVILAQHGVDPEFPDEVINEVTEIPLEIPESTIAKRRDLRGEVIFTIDPDTAKDFDDALSVEPLEGGRWRLGVHIADVAEHVRPGTALDASALERATSIYPIDKVIPMLPERLSNLVCSLRPDEDSLALSVFMVIDKEGNFAERPEMCESIICSKRRLDYGQVQRFFDDKMSKEDREAVEPVADEIRTVREVARTLAAMRERRGALDLDLPETEIVIHEKSRHVTDVLRRDRWESHRLVEQCMLAANEAVAEFLFKKRIPAVYRDHDEPDAERLASLLPVLRSLGLKDKIDLKRLRPKDYQHLLVRTAKHPARRVIHRLLLRTLMLAVYDPENRGHFGLASSCYTHFTSPIRRYPDLLVHRILKDRLRGKPLPAGPALEAWEASLEAMAKLSSTRERRAERVERDMTALKTLRYLQPRLGEEMPGMITGVAPHGLWIELDEVPFEGFAHITTLGEDWFEHDPNLHVLRGEDTNVVWRLGQRVQVRLTSVDLTALELDLVIKSAL